MNNILNFFNTSQIIGNSWQDWTISASIIAGAFVLNLLIIYINKNIIQKITARTNSRIDDILFKLLEGPVLFGIILVAIWLAADRLVLTKEIDKIISTAYKFLIVANITWFVGRLTKALIEEYMLPKSHDSEKHKHLDYHLIILIRKVAVGFIWAIGFVMALKNVGVDVSAMLGTLGIGGLAFALAAQDTIKNIFGGITIFSDRPFRLGDRIKVDGFDGFVEDIGIRSTRIRTMEKKLVTIPNSKLTDASIENISEEPMRRVLLNLGLTYQTSPEMMEEALNILKKINKKVKGVSPDDITAYFENFGAYSLNINYVYFIKKNADIPATISEVNQSILIQFKEAGLCFAYPTQIVQIENLEKK